MTVSRRGADRPACVGRESPATRGVNVAVKMPTFVLMNYLRSPNRLPRIFAVVTASFILSGLALAGTDNGKGNGGNNNGNQNGKNKGDPSISSVPEANAGWVLVPFMGAVLLFSSLQLSRLKAQKS